MAGQTIANTFAVKKLKIIKKHENEIKWVVYRIIHSIADL
jgi:hypothetical protein